MVQELSEKEVDKVRKQVKVMVDLVKKGIQFLLIAHGAGIGACVAALKDYSTVPALKGIGTFVSIFSFGFVLAMIAYITLIHYQTSIIENTFSPGKINVRQFSLGLWLASTSSALLAGALALLVSKLGSL
jgi:hypothetical protein